MSAFSLSKRKRPHEGAWSLIGLRSSGKRAVDTGLAELSPSYNLRHGEPICPQFLDLLHNLAGQDLVWTKPHPRGLRLVDAVLLTLAADVILEFGYQASFFSRGSVDGECS